MLLLSQTNKEPPCKRCNGEVQGPTPQTRPKKDPANGKTGSAQRLLRLAGSAYNALLVLVDPPERMFTPQMMQPEPEPEPEPEPARGST